MENERLTSLEVKCAYLEDFLNNLQEVVVEQGKVIDSLKGENTSLKKKLTELSDAVEGEIPQVKPPHY